MFEAFDKLNPSNLSNLSNLSNFHLSPLNGSRGRSPSQRSTLNSNTQKLLTQTLIQVVQVVSRQNERGAETAPPRLILQDVLTSQAQP